MLINVGVLLIALDVIALTLLCSTLLRSSVAAGGAAFVAYVVYSTAPRFWQPLADSLPTVPPSHATDLIAGTWTATNLTRPVVGGVVVAVAVVGAYWSLQHQEV